MSHIKLDRIVCATPDGRILFPELSDTISNEVVGLVGRNGCGKSTLLRTIAGQLAPYAGSASSDGTVYLVSQTSYPDRMTVGQLLGVQKALEVLDRLEYGLSGQNDLEAADWTLPARLEKVLSDCGLVALDMERPVNSLSGGERNRAKTAAVLLARPDILLLDEPTNDLDTDGRKLIANVIGDWTGPVLVASHDRDLLENVDRIIELSTAGILSVEGGWSAFMAARETHRTLARNALDQARSDAKAASKARQGKIERLDQRSRQGRQSAARRDASRLEINAKRERAESTSARNRAVGDQRFLGAQSNLKLAEAAVERVTPVEIALPQCGLLSSHVVLEAEALTCEYDDRTVFEALSLKIVGAERIFLGGCNGSGKSSLARILAGQALPKQGAVHADYSRVAVLDQHLDMLLPTKTAFQEMQRHSPDLDRNGTHAVLAKFGFRADWASRKISEMSGGEKVRLALACLFSGEKPPHLLILDEPTNHLDIYAIETLEKALLDYDGALLCITHEDAFRRNLKLSRSIELAAR
ncbi:ABC-F family ATP-binding cassette domain-containing protein [Erythrobacter sp. JK5]|uniref:ABC-F family ATP-binding cassette domain-containing protein n=1 Tax=Erythrobacter sp. JK5 TaxID=2829500 RepID=UPI001BAB8F06|nr:ABC-F family ATP-binding cassette domain-containing protein [Erythrobacter sp. JK5]QUL37619.1 ABC-F family ATP-binding cassette domain-containing protein [Erythrobacter sp. JK5]